MLAAVLATALAFLVPTATFAAPGGGNCDQNPDPSCITWGSGGGGAGGGGSAGGHGCTWRGQAIPCTDVDYGSYIGDGCYWKVLVPQPVLPTPPGKDPATGAWGVTACYSAPGGGAVTQVYAWMDNGAVGPTPVQLAQQALARIHLLGAQIGVAPQPGGAGAVGLPVWLWTAVTPGTWGPLTASASGGGITVTITAKATRIVWAMGDGHQVVCTNPGTPYQPGYGLTASPTCPYTYAAPSSTTAHPHGRYTVTATTFWRVHWSGGGQSGVLNPTSRSQSSVEIGEIQVVTQ